MAIPVPFPSLHTYIHSPINGQQPKVQNGIKNYQDSRHFFVLWHLDMVPHYLEVRVITSGLVPKHGVRLGHSM